ncbi:unnamed protein product [Mycena citricolor]|uniref:Uncharacterized protein n=1 Tax=Mycena citricolor TaxID=2018698 RepID=A0AAD2HXE2_9AGAR|nr:unnamed protein product [Mycena citricolor]
MRQYLATFSENPPPFVMGHQIFRIMTLILLYSKYEMSIVSLISIFVTICTNRVFECQDFAFCHSSCRTVLEFVTTGFASESDLTSERNLCVLNRHL